MFSLFGYPENWDIYYRYIKDTHYYVTFFSLNGFVKYFKSNFTYKLNADVSRRACSVNFLGFSPLNFFIKYSSENKPIWPNLSQMSILCIH